MEIKKQSRVTSKGFDIDNQLMYKTKRQFF